MCFRALTEEVALGGAGAGAGRGGRGATVRRRARLWTSKPWSRLELGSLEMADQCFTKKIEGSQLELLKTVIGLSHMLLGHIELGTFTYNIFLFVSICMSLI